MMHENKVLVVEEQLEALANHLHVKNTKLVNNSTVELVYLPKAKKNSSHKRLGSQYRIRIELTDSYPEEPPSIKFIDPIDHINVCSRTGLVHCPPFMEEWTPYFSFSTIIDLLDLLMIEPQHDPKYKMNHQSTTFSDLNKSEELKPLQMNSSGSQNEKKSLRNTQKTSSQPRQLPSEPSATEEDKTQLFHQPPQAQSQQAQTSPNAISKQEIFQSVEDETEKQEQIKSIGSDPLEDINQEGQQNSKTYSQLGESKRNAPVSFSRASLVQKAKLTTSLDADGLIFKEYQKTDTTSNMRDGRIIEKKLPTLKKTASFEIQMDPQETMKRVPFTNVSPQIKNSIAMLKNTIFLESTERQLQHVNRLLLFFIKDYQQLQEAQKATRNQKLLEIIVKKKEEQIAMIEELQQLSSSLKAEMLCTVKKKSRVSCPQ